MIVSAAVVFFLSHSEPAPADAETQPVSTGAQEATQQLQGLEIADEVREGYEREHFGSGWADLDGDRCDTRQEILQRDLDQVNTSDGCKVQTGVLQDPYTGQEIEFTRGQDSSMAVQIDHVVAAAQAWYSGAYTWDDARRIEFFNDPDNLMAVDGPANNSKGAGRADEWLPEHEASRCDYVSRQIHVKDKYQLTITSTESEVMRSVLSTC